MAGHRRLDTRYSIEFPAKLVHGKQPHSLVTEDVSEGGVFLRTESPPPLLQLVQVQLVLPIGGHALSAHGMTVHVVTADSSPGRVAGIGVQFYALDQATRDAWQAFTRYVAAHCPEASDQTPLRLLRGATPKPLSRRFLRHTAVLELKPETQERLEEMHSREMPTGRLMVPTSVDLATGTVVVVHVTHPDNGAPFLLQATIVGRTGAGLVVALFGHDRRAQEEFLDFVRRSIVFDEEDVTPEPGETGEGSST